MVTWHRRLFPNADAVCRHDQFPDRVLLEGPSPCAENTQALRSKNRGFGQGSHELDGAYNKRRLYTLQTTEWVYHVGLR